MRSFCKRGIAISLGVLWSSVACAQDGPMPLALPETGPQFQAYTGTDYATPAAYTGPRYYAPSVASRQASPATLPSPTQGISVAPGPQGDGTLPSPGPYNGAGSSGQGGSVYDEMLNSGWGDSNNAAGSAACQGSCDVALPSCCCSPMWFGSIAGIVLGRDNPNRFWTTFQTNNNANQLLNTVDAGANWNGGGEVTVGRWCCPNCWGRTGIMFSYFTVHPLEGTASIRDVTNNLSTPIDLNTQVGTVNIGGRPAADFFDNSREHRIFRSDEIHDLELTLLNQQLVCNGHSQITWMAGARYFRFDETVTFSAVAGAGAIAGIVGGSEFGNNGGVDEGHLDSRVINQLVGFQVGGRADYCLTDRWGIFVIPKFGIYGNDITSRVHLYDGAGNVGFDISDHKNDFSLMGQLDAGVNYQFAQNWRAFVGYRAIGVTRLALADNQFLPFLADAAGFADTKSNGDLILHGGYAGVEWRF